jgi:hypothetical protein
MSEFDKLKDEAGKEVKDHPEQVEQAINKKAGIIIQDDEAAKRDQGGKPEGGGAGQSQGG